MTISNSSGQSGLYCPEEKQLYANQVNGNILVSGLNSGGSFYICSAHVGRNVNLLDNAGRTDISSMTIGGNLNCEDNSPAPTSWMLVNTLNGSGITASHKNGQCSAF